MKILKQIKPHYWLLGAILLLAFLWRVYRLDELLGFYYDQGRDALVVWELIHNKKFFLIGPTTGIEGIFLGPFFYYLITPFYWLGQGNPLWPAVFLVLLNVAAIAGIYYLGQKYFSRRVGILAALIAATSSSLAGDNRWLSNPNPLVFTSVAVFILLGEVVRGRVGLLPLVTLLMGIGLHFEAASAVFFIPSLLVTLVAFRKKIPVNFRLLLLSALTFGLTLVPQILFDFRHDHILVKAFQKFLITERSFTSSPFAILPSRLETYLFVLTDKFIPASREIRLLFLAAFGLLLLGNRKIFSNEFARLLAIWILVPFLLLLLYTGNNGYVWGYYFTGIFSLLILLVSAVILQIRQKTLLIGVLAAIFYFNFTSSLAYFKQPLDNPALVSLGTSLAAVDWVYQDADGRVFNTDVYVPPVIPYAYDYLFLWRGHSRYNGKLASQEIVPLLYTIEEVDLDNEVLLNAWLSRQAGFSSIEVTEKFGGVTVRRRARHTLNP